MPVVKCSVANCFFWDEGNECNADAIMVDVDRNTNRKYDEEIGGEFVSSDQQEYSARISADTCCHTFKPKHSR
ncbi:DUF1540 domain-containing protein [Kroppenstedtia pulmonis]|uniref:DUF1540 domain-containing protein n=1 Tax=Kroppenstedtia pulmonis TaxID=1380685 RepID=A0A7D3XS95_9BACL|nr:DUF1540 domain-containing protein [Kroppenstedtia pulmonis]QKG84908.1 DUF1540 domain-containing protein [Kroppenstedtia pulmonis]